MYIDDMKNKTGWYFKAKLASINKESDLDWKGIGKGLGTGALLGTIPAAVGLFNQPNMQQKDNQQTHQVSYTAPQVNRPQQSVQEESPKSSVIKNQKENEEIQKPSFVSEDELANFIAPFEGGFISKPYKDSKGIWTVGCGFNLERKDADKILSSFGVSKQDLISGKKELTKEQMINLFKINLSTAIKDAKQWIPNLEEQPKEVQMICVDMSFNMGLNTILTFKNTAKAITEKKYDEAAKHMKNSKWFNQVGNRSKHHVRVMESLSNHQ